jgi:hypothetical protein
VPSIYRALALEPRAVVVEYPMASPLAAFTNAPYMLYSTRHWKRMVNGYSGFVPESYRRNWERTHRFPEPAALTALIELGVTHVVVHTAAGIVAAGHTPGLTRVVSTSDAAIFRLDRKYLGGGR